MQIKKTDYNRHRAGNAGAVSVFSFQISLRANLATLVARENKFSPTRLHKFSVFRFQISAFRFQFSLRANLATLVARENKFSPTRLHKFSHCYPINLSPNHHNINKKANGITIRFMGWVSYLHRAATTCYLCCGQALEDSQGAGRIGLPIFVLRVQR